MAVDTIARGMAASAQGGSGTTDYTQLSNKPSINGVTLSGSKSLSDLGISPELNIVTSPAWGGYMSGGETTPAVTLPTFGTPTATQTFIYTFTAASTSMSFTAPADAMLIDADGTESYSLANTLSITDLTAGTLYECSFACYQSTLSGTTHNYIVLVYKGYDVA